MEALSRVLERQHNQALARRVGFGRWRMFRARAVASKAYGRKEVVRPRQCIFSSLDDSRVLLQLSLEARELSFALRDFSGNEVTEGDDIAKSFVNSTDVRPGNFLAERGPVHGQPARCSVDARSRLQQRS